LVGPCFENGQFQRWLTDEELEANRRAHSTVRG
jgi:hypothetical protein